jgi:hypothetical protein
VFALVFALIPAPRVFRAGAGSAVTAGIFFASVLRVGLTWGRGASMAVEMGMVNSVRPTVISPMTTLTDSPTDSLVNSFILAATGAFKFFVWCRLGFGACSGVSESGVAARAMQGATRVVIHVNSVEMNPAGSTTKTGCGQSVATGTLLDNIICEDPP